MSYETAPATIMLATQCAICQRPLVDSISIETGMGPDCRSKHGFSGKNAPTVSEDDRKKANRIVYAIACGVDSATLAGSIKELRDMGFSLLAATLEDRNVTVHVDEAGDRLVVRTPYNEAVVEAMRAIPGRRWNKEEKANTFPVSAKRAVWEMIKRFYPGQLLKGSKGIVVIG